MTPFHPIFAEIVGAIMPEQNPFGSPEGLLHLSDALVADLMTTSDEDILREIVEDGQDPDAVVSAMRRHIDKILAEPIPAPPQPTLADAYLFQSHHCPVCQDGKLPCRGGRVNLCGNPRARND